MRSGFSRQDLGALASAQCLSGFNRCVVVLWTDDSKDRIGGAHAPSRVPFAAPGKGGRHMAAGLVFGEGTENDTRGRVCSPQRELPRVLPQRTLSSSTVML